MTTQNNDNVTNNVTTDSQEETTSKTKTSEEMSGTNEMPDTYEMDDGKFSWKFILTSAYHGDILQIKLNTPNRIHRKHQTTSRAHNHTQREDLNHQTGNLKSLLNN